MMRTPYEGQTADPRSARRGRRRRWAAIRSGIVILALAAVLFVAGFALFLRQIETGPPDDGIIADGIVVLTGGDSRVTEALRLLAAGSGQRLLISGVHPKTTAAMLRSLNPDAARLFDCCIDLDRNARDTIENANETRRWLSRQGFRSVIVVTSSYHMPRGLVELRRALPDLKLVPYPVAPPKLPLDEWWAHPGTLRLLASEFVKYAASLSRCVAVRVMAGSAVYRGVRGCVAPLSV